MGLQTNENKQLEIVVNNKIYNRYAIKTHFVKPGENYLDLVEKYVLPYYKENDVLIITEKVISICQNRIIYKKDIVPSSFAKKAVKKLEKSNSEQLVKDFGDLYKMEIVIQLCGIKTIKKALSKIRFAKPEKKYDIFYSFLNPETIGLDGLVNERFDDYSEVGIMIPADPLGVCKKIYEKLKIRCAIVDANDKTIEIFAKSLDVQYTNQVLKALLVDNPAGQDKETTPFILIRDPEYGKKKYMDI